MNLRSKIKKYKINQDLHKLISGLEYQPIDNMITCRKIIPTIQNGNFYFELHNGYLLNMIDTNNHETICSIYINYRFCEPKELTKCLYNIFKKQIKEETGFELEE